MHPDTPQPCTPTPPSDGLFSKGDRSSAPWPAPAPLPPQGELLCLDQPPPSALPQQMQTNSRAPRPLLLGGSPLPQLRPHSSARGSRRAAQGAGGASAPSQGRGCSRQGPGALRRGRPAAPRTLLHPPRSHPAGDARRWPQQLAKGGLGQQQGHVPTPTGTRRLCLVLKNLALPENKGMKMAERV